MARTKNRADVKEIATLAKLALQTESREIRQSRGDLMQARLGLSALQPRAGTPIPSESDVSQGETN